MRRFVGLFGAAMLICALSSMQAQTTWMVSSGTWTTAANWSAGAPTSNSGTAIINNSGTALVPAAVSGSYNVLQLGTTSGGAGTLNVSGGYVFGSYAYVGYAAGSTGTITVASGTFTDYQRLSVGTSGTGNFSLSGGVVNNRNVLIGELASGVGSVTVTSGSMVSDSIVVGGTGAGTLLVNGGYASSTVLGLTIGNAIGSSGTVTVTSGTLSNTSITVGNSGKGTLVVNGGRLTGDSSANIGGANSIATITSGSWVNSSNIFVGNSGTGSLVVDGGYASGNVVGVGYGAGSGTATVSSGTLLANVELNIGSSGTGSMTVSGGLVRASGDTKLGESTGGRGTLVLTGGTLSTNRIIESAGTGTLTINGGAIQARANQANFIANFEQGDVTIGANGAKIDSNGFAIGIATNLVGTGTLTKVGTGTLTLSGSNSYSGGTVVTGGLVLITGDNSDAGDVMIQGGAVGGSGHISDVTVASSGTLGGPSPALLTIEDNLTMQPGSTLAISITGTSTFSQMAIGGTFAAGGTLYFNFGYTPTEGTSFTIFTNGVTGRGWTSGSFLYGTNLGPGLVVDTSALATTGVVTVIPEPASVALIGLGATALLLLRRRSGTT